MKEELQQEYNKWLTIESFQNNGIEIKFHPSIDKEIIPQILFNFHNSVYLLSGYVGKINVI